MKTLKAVVTSLVLLSAAACADSPSTSGLVKDGDGHPIKGARVSLSSATSGKAGLATTDSLGKFVVQPIGIKQEPVRLLVCAAKFEISVNDYQAPSAIPANLTVTLKPLSDSTARNPRPTGC